MFKIRRAVAMLATTIIASAAVAAPTAGAAPIDERRAEAARIQNAIDANGMRISALGERYNGARIAMDRATAAIADAERRVEAAKSQVTAIRAQVNGRAARLYKGTGDRSPLDALAVRRARELGTRSKYAAAAASNDGAAIEMLTQRQEALAVQQRALEVKRQQAKAQRDAAAAAKAELNAANNRQKVLLASVQGDIARLVRIEQARRESAARAAALARLAASRTPTRARTGSTSRRGAPTDAGFPDVPVSGRVAAVIAYARAQIGKPYRYATAGPNTFDCSGLTMMAWRQAGVGMAHFSGAQFNAFPHVSLSALQPGDLLFKGPGGRDHVALYIGGGMQIAATHTGDFVRLQPMVRNPSGAVRPG